MTTYISRVFRDTLSAVGGGAGLITAFLFPAAGAVLHFARDGRSIMQAELYVWLLYTAIPLAAYLIAVLLWNMASAPYRIQRDRANAANRRAEELESGAKLPTSVLRSLEESQHQREALNQQITAIAMLVEQYRRLIAATRQFADFSGGDLREDDLTLIARFLADQTAAMLPALPHRPNEPLTFQIGWNRYRYILSVPMRITPKVTFPDLPEGVSASVVDGSRIHVDVDFWHSPSHNKEQVLPQGVMFNSRFDAEL